MTALIRADPTSHGQRATPRLSSLGGIWSTPAALRAIRAAVIIPALLAITLNVLGNLQMATYAAFGGFANLVLASFTGSRRDRLLAHIGLGVVGSALLCVGTAIHTSTTLTSPVTLVVSFIVLLSAAIWANAGAGGLAAMLAYVLSAASPGSVSMIPSRLGGWWLATAAAGIAITVMSPRPPGSKLRATTAAFARALAREINGVAQGSLIASDRSDAAQAQTTLRTAFNEGPYRPLGLATADQAVANLIELLEWVDDLVDDMMGDLVNDKNEIASIDHLDRQLLLKTGEVLDVVAGMLIGQDVLPDIDGLERLRVDRADGVRHLGEAGGSYEVALHASFHARAVAVAVRGVAGDALVATGRASPEALAQRRTAWLPSQSRSGERSDQAPINERRAGVFAAGNILARHASLRSVWVRNSLRGAIAVTAAVTVADVLKVQHGFWVVLGTLAVLRTTAIATGGTAARTIAGTTLGFLIGGALVLAVGTDATVLWAIFPIAVLIAAYAPGIAPFAIAQAAFTILIVVLYNLIVPVGWKVGVIRFEDVVLGCAVSLIVGSLLWPRGAMAVVADDLADTFVVAARYLIESAQWALALREAPQDEGRPAINASLRLEDALRALLVEQGAKSVSKEDLWALVGATQRLRLTAAALAELPAPAPSDLSDEPLLERARTISDWYRTVGSHIQHGQPPRLQPLEPVNVIGEDDEPPGYRRACRHYVDQHLYHLPQHHQEVIQPAAHLSRALHQPWWRHSAIATAPIALSAQHELETGTSG